MAYMGGINSNYGGSSIYQNRNVISGLASGMDTESMIENAVSGYKMKIEKLMQSKTKTEWRQESYRSIIQKMASFTDKYMSYASPTNLMSGSFFNSAMKIISQGVNKDKVSASGNPGSEVQILGVKRLAQSATYRISGLGGGGTDPSVEGENIDLSEKMEVSNIAGSMSINYGGSKRVDITFSKDEIFKDDPQGTPNGKTANEKLADAINEKLSKQTITIGETTYKASDKILATYDKDTGAINLTPQKGEDAAGNSVYISSAYGGLKDTLGIDVSDPDKKVSSITVKDKVLVDDSKTMGDYLSGKKLTVNLDGVSKEITLPTYKAGETTMDQLRQGIQDEMDRAFGKGKITVEYAPDPSADPSKASSTGKLTLKTQKYSSLIMEDTEGSGALRALGFGKDASTFVDARKSLGDIYNGKNIFDGLAQSKAEGKVSLRKGQDGASDYYVDSEGYKVVKNGTDPDGKDVWLRVDDKGNALYDFEINGVRVGSFNKDTQLTTVMNAINGNSKADVSVNYSRTTDEFTFTSKTSGANGKVTFGGGLAEKMFGDKAGTVERKAGEDAILSMKVNGKEMIDVTRPSNDFNIDGLNIRVNDVFGYENGQLSATAEKDAVSFKGEADADKIVDAVKEMVKDYNEMVTELKNAFSTLPLQKSSGKYYEPLTSKDMEKMSESAIKAYEEKAKQGILFADRDLSALYDRLRRAITPEGQTGADMRAIGITVEYKGGLSTLKLDESALRQAISATPDKVKDVFTKSQENGAESNGLMQALKAPLDMYGKVHGGKGILVEKAGSPLSPTSIYNNIIQQELDRYTDQIDSLEKKMNSQIDRYTKQFSKMEQLIAAMNSQSSSLAGLMGGF